jgi:hypothetical protein
MDDLGCGRLASTPSSRRDPAFFRVGICAPSTETRPRSRSVVPKGFRSRRRARGRLEGGNLICAHQLIGPSPTDVVVPVPQLLPSQTQQAPLAGPEILDGPCAGIGALGGRLVDAWLAHGVARRSADSALA